MSLQSKLMWGAKIHTADQFPCAEKFYICGLKLKIGYKQNVLIANNGRQ